MTHPNFWNFDSELPVLQSHIPELKIYCQPDWGSKENSNYRTSIREGIIQMISPTSESTSSQILNLQKLPKAEGLSLSVSHCESLGGFASATVPIGFDIFDRKRFNLTAIQRVCSQEETQSCADPAFLWPAKESVFKLASEKFKVLSEIEILNWMPATDEISIFEVTSKADASIRGFVISKNDFLLAVSFYA